MAKSNGEVGYISAAAAAAAAFAKVSHLRILTYDLRFLGSSSYYDGDNLQCKLSRIVDGNEAATFMEKCNKDTAGYRHLTRR